MCVCLSVCVFACLLACLHACVRACVRVSVCPCVLEVWDRKDYLLLCRPHQLYSFHVWFFRMMMSGFWTQQVLICQSMTCRYWKNHEILLFHKKNEKNVEIAISQEISKILHSIFLFIWGWYFLVISFISDNFTCTYVIINAWMIRLKIISSDSTMLSVSLFIFGFFF